MKSIILTIGLAILTCCSIAFGAADWDIYSDTVISEGTYNLINIYDTPPDHTMVNMYGGSADYITTYDESMLNFFGDHAEIGASDYSTVNIYSGSLSGAAAYHYGVVNLYDVEISTSLGAYDNGIANMYGGSVDHVGAVGSGEVNIYCGLITDKLFGSESGTLNLYAYDFHYDPIGGEYDGGYITGRWICDDSYFAINLYGSNTISHINIVPEPATMLLFGAGALISLRRRISRNS